MCTGLVNLQFLDKQNGKWLSFLHGGHGLPGTQGAGGQVLSGMQGVRGGSGGRKGIGPVKGH
jgi:hypothetical protein